MLDEFMMKTTIFNIAIATTLLGQTTTSFGLDLSQIDRASVSESSPSQRCYTAERMNLADYSTKDLETETKLCAIQLESAGLCPKLTSTSAGIKVFDNSLNLNLSDFNQRFCVSQKPIDSQNQIKLKSLGKFKHTMDLTYSQSNLTYYHLSRILDAGRVPVSVLKTLSAKTHQTLTENAVSNLTALNIPTTKIISQSWRNLLARYKATDAKQRRGFIDDKSGVAAGVMVDNIKDDFIYAELDKFPDLNNLDATPLYKKVFSNLSINEIVGADRFQKIAAAQTSVEMKDISDMIVMDTILNQVDRYGNMAKKNIWYFVENNKLNKVSADYDPNNKVLETQKIEMKAKNAVLVKEMYLIDNDAGLIFESEFAKKNYVSNLTHLSPRTYTKLLSLYKNREAFEHLMVRSLLVGPQTADKIENNLIRVTEKLIERCKSGELKLDIDRDYVIGLKTTLDKVSCE